MEGLGSGACSPHRRRLRRGLRLVGCLELATGVAAVIGGTLLVVRPDGSLLAARLSALEGSPFSDWRAPGVVLATVVGGGGLVARAWLMARRPYGLEISALYGLGLVVFELVEVGWIGFQPLEVVVGLIGVLLAVVAWRERTVIGGEL